MLRLQSGLREAVVDGLAGGVAAAVLSGAPSTVHALATGGDVLEAPRAAGSILVGPDHGTGTLLAAAVPAHGALSLGWGAVLGVVLPRRHEPAWGAVAGLAIAALDLGVVGRRFPRIDALPLAPQLADHAAFGAVVGWVVRECRRRRALGAGTDAPRRPAPGRAPTPSPGERAG